MSSYTLTMTLPQQLYERLQDQAQAGARSVDEVIAEALTRSLPPEVEADLPPALHRELEAMAHLSDAALWQIAQATMNPDKVAFAEVSHPYDVLLERNRDGTLTPEGRAWLTRLRDEAEALTLRKAHAYALLQSRGHRVPFSNGAPTLEELQTQNV